MDQPIIHQPILAQDYSSIPKSTLAITAQSRLPITKAWNGLNPDAVHPDAQ